MSDTNNNTVKWNRVIALGLAVLHHGMSNFTPNEDAVPPSKDTTITTANTYLRWLSGGNT